MTNSAVNSRQPPWQRIAQELKLRATTPSTAQIELSTKLGIQLRSDLPYPVAACVLRGHLAPSLNLNMREEEDREIPEALGELEDELGTPRTTSLLTNSREEVGAWFEARYCLKTANGLDTLRPEAGDIVTSSGWPQKGEERVISSIGPNGRVHMKGRPSRSAWPNALERIAKKGDADYSTLVTKINNGLRNRAPVHSVSIDKFTPLHKWKVSVDGQSEEVIRQLEDLLESGEVNERPFQKLIEEHPELLSSLVVGNIATYVIPQAHLGEDYIPDFLVLGLNSLGPSWVTVEIEAPRHPVTLKDGSPDANLRHALKQVDDWRSWLEDNIGYAHTRYGLHGLTTHAQGLVVIGRGDVRGVADAQIVRTAREKRIDIHSWDWVLREARNRSGNGTYRSQFYSQPDADFIPGESDILEIIDALDEE